MDLKNPLTQWEAARVITEYEDKYGKKVKYRVLVGYSPVQIGARLGVRPEDIAKMAGRNNGKEMT